jgi:hypothetical protein
MCLAGSEAAGERMGLPIRAFGATLKPEFIRRTASTIKFEEGGILFAFPLTHLAASARTAPTPSG